MDPQLIKNNIAPFNLLCNSRTNSLGIDPQNTMFSWQLNERCSSQTAYQVQVFTGSKSQFVPEQLVWDSGQVASGQSVHIPYAGPELQPGTKYRWKVRVWDDQGQPTLYSGWSSFVTGLTNGFESQWIWSQDRTDKNQHVFFRKEVALGQKTIVSAFAFVTADDYYKLYINGEFVGQGPAPGYPLEQYHYNAIEITDYCRPGEPLLMSAHAYYQGLNNYVWVSDDDRRGLILQLHIHYDDGTSEVLGTDETWRVHESDAYGHEHIIGMQTGFNENIDARKLPLGWNQFGFDDSDWDHAAIVEEPDWKLHPQETDMLTVYEIEPESIIEKAPGHYFFDFGREVVGTLRASFHGDDGQKIQVRLGEELEASHVVRHELRCHCLYEDVWTLRDGPHQIEHYDYRGFRYGEMIGTPSHFDPKTIRAVVRHYPYDADVSHFDCSDQNINSMWELAKYSIGMGTQEVYVDCPTREKANYSLDAYLQMSAALYQTGEANFGRRMIELLLQSAPDGKLRCLGPAGRDHFFTEYTMYPILMAWRYFMHTGDVGFLNRNFDAMGRVEQYFESEFGHANGLLIGTDDVLHDLVDWPRHRRDGHEMLPVNTVVNAVYYRVLVILMETARLIGHERAALEYEVRANKMRRTMNDKLWDSKSKCYVDGMDGEERAGNHGSLHSNVFSLAMGIVPPERTKEVIHYIKQRGFNCNTFLAMFLFECLYDHGAADYAFRLLTAEGRNSPMHMVREGATTTWEVWDLEQKANASLFHPATAFTGYIIASRIMGITPLEPGFKKVRIAPQPGPIDQAKIRVPTIYGPIVVEYEQRSNQTVSLHVEIPSNVTAQISASGRIIADDVGPGTHCIQYKVN